MARDPFGLSGSSRECQHRGAEGVVRRMFHQTVIGQVGQFILISEFSPGPDSRSHLRHVPRRAMANNLDTFVKHKLPLPEPLAISSEILDRQSAFVAYIFRASTPAKARSIHSHVRQIIHAKRPASHEIMAWRCKVLKEGQTGLRGDDDFKIEEGSEDDGEQWAGTHVLKVMRSEAIMDVVVVVSRW